MTSVCHVFYKCFFLHPNIIPSVATKIHQMYFYAISIQKSWVNNESVGCYWNYIYGILPQHHGHTNRPDRTFMVGLLTFIVHRCAIGSMTTTINTISTPLSGRTKEWHPFKKEQSCLRSSFGLNPLCSSLSGYIWQIFLDDTVTSPNGFSPTGSLTHTCSKCR